MSRFKDRLPSPAIVVALVALFVAMSGSAVAATTLLVHTGNIANGAVTGSKIANGAVGMNKLARTAPGRAGQVRRAAGNRQRCPGSSRIAGTPGDTGSERTGRQRRDGRDGLNPAVPVVDVPTTAHSSGKNPNPDSGDPGDGGWYFSGDGDRRLRGAHQRRARAQRPGHRFQHGAGRDRDREGVQQRPAWRSRRAHLPVARQRGQHLAAGTDDPHHRHGSHERLALRLGLREPGVQPDPQQCLAE